MKKTPAPASPEEKAYIDQAAKAAEGERRRAAMYAALEHALRSDRAAASAATDRERYLEWREERKAKISGKKNKPLKKGQKRQPDVGERLYGIHPLAGYEGNIPVLEIIRRKGSYGLVDMGYRNLASDNVSRMVKLGRYNDIQAQAAQILSELYDARAPYPGMKWEAPVDGGGFQGGQARALEAAQALTIVFHAAGIYGAMALEHVIARGAEVQDIVTLGIATDTRAAGLILRNALDAAAMVFGLREPPRGHT